jgi:hypothetical protein
VFPAKVTDVAHIQLAQAKGLVKVVIRRADQQVGDVHVLRVLFGILVVAGLTANKRSEGQTFGDLARNDCILILGYLTSERQPNHFFTSAAATIGGLSFSFKYIFF